MRTWMRVEKATGEVTEGWTESRDVGQDLRNLLGILGLDNIRFTNRNGMSVTYTAWEYECEVCGQYDHTIDFCPNMADGPDAGEPEYDERP